MPNFSLETEIFIAEFDAAIEAHMMLTRRILRCAVLRESPGDDVLSPVAHTLCCFGRWFTSNVPYFEMVDTEATQRIVLIHQFMHDSSRSICNNVMDGRAGNNIDLDNFEKSQSELLILLAKLKTLVLSHAVRHDPLTGLPLRYGIENDFALAHKDALRNNFLLYAAMIDVDHFKLVNDQYGHPVGDIVLRHLASSLKLLIRGNDPLYRFGGEEFLWLLRCRSPDEAAQSAHRAITTIERTPIPIGDDQSLFITITIGLAQIGENEGINEAIIRADTALYKGKHAGRNQYVIS
jgi:diguanylate cyclase